MRVELDRISQYSGSGVPRRSFLRKGSWHGPLRARDKDSRRKCPSRSLVDGGDDDGDFNLAPAANACLVRLDIDRRYFDDLVRRRPCKVQVGRGNQRRMAVAIEKSLERVHHVVVIEDRGVVAKRR